MDFGYIRVSTIEQNTGRQLAGLELDKVLTERCSGKDRNRPQLNILLESIREGDTVHVHDISRMARNLEDLHELVNLITSKGCTITFHKENLIFTSESNDPFQRLMLDMLGSVYQFERSMLLERQKEGIQKARQAGKYKGRKLATSPHKIAELLESGMSIRKTAEKLGIAKSTVQKYKKNLQGC